MKSPLAAALLLTLAAPVRPACAQSYTIIDLGPINPGDGTRAAAISPNGQAVGLSGDGAALWNGSGPALSLGMLSGGLNSNASSINLAGLIAGTSALPSYPSVHACLWTNGVPSDLGTLGGVASEARGISAGGRVAGVSETSAGIDHACFWDAGAITDLGTLPGGQSSGAFAINAADQVTGVSTAPDGTDHAFLSSDGVLTDLGTLPGGTQSRGLGIGGDGTVVGEATVGANWHAFVARGGTLTDLGTAPGDTDSRAVSVNAHGQIVGSSRCVSGAFSEQSACLWQNGVFSDLNDRIPVGTGWMLTDATGINDAGQITGQGMFQGHVEAFRLSPLPAAIAGRVALQGWVGAPQPLTFTLTPTGSTTGTAMTQTLTTAADGSFTLTGAPVGTYTLGIKGDRWLRKDVPVDTTGGDVSGLALSLLGGDITGDNRVFIQDYNLLSAAYGATPASANWNPLADINGDGRVNIQDYNILSSNYNKFGDP